MGEGVGDIRMAEGEAVAEDEDSAEFVAIADLVACK